MDLDPIDASARTILQRLCGRLSGSADTSTIADFVRKAQDVEPYDDYKIFPDQARVLSSLPIFAVKVELAM